MYYPNFDFDSSDTATQLQSVFSIRSLAQGLGFGAEVDRLSTTDSYSTSSNSSEMLKTPAYIESGVQPVHRLTGLRYLLNFSLF